MSTRESRHPVVSRSQWLAARQQLWLHEKAFTHHRDALTAARRALPWVKVEQDYRFFGPNGALSLADLFAGRSQLLLYHFMFAEGWSEAAPAALFWPTTMTAPICTWPTTMCRWWRCHGRRMPNSRHFASAWAGSSRGIRRMAATSTRTLASVSAAKASGSTTMSRMRAMKASCPA